MGSLGSRPRHATGWIPCVRSVPSIHVLYTLLFITLGLARLGLVYSRPSPFQLHSPPPRGYIAQTFVTRLRGAEEEDDA
ncbi:hypothetical protein ACKKBG_A05250 [Auxenochlorella protothecoides x Auxenochlorella symbiontica]